MDGEAPPASQSERWHAGWRIQRLTRNRARKSSTCGGSKLGSCATSARDPRIILSGARLSRRLARPAFERVRERADFLVTEQPRDRGNRRVRLPQVGSRQVVSEFVQNSGETQS